MRTTIAIVAGAFILAGGALAPVAAFAQNQGCTAEPCKPGTAAASPSDSNTGPEAIRHAPIDSPVGTGAGGGGSSAGGSAGGDKGANGAAK